MSTGRIEADDAWAAIERFFVDGLTDGLPVVPPRSDLVEAALDAAGLAADDTVGVIEPRLLTITAGQVAVNAVMAGCRPEYLPVVVAAVEGICRGRFNIHGASVSTGGSAQLLIVNGPIRHALGLNSGPNLFGPGFRPNATIGRAIRLIHINVLGNRPGEVDMSCLGHPGKFSFCIAENEELSPWAPLHVEQGFSKDESAVTVINVLSPHQVHSLTNKPLEVVQTRIAEAIADCGHGFGNFVVVLGPEHVAQLEGEGWTKERVKAFLYEKARRPAEFYRRVGQLGDGDTSDPVAALTGPEAARIVVGGGMAGAFSAVIPTWGFGVASEPQTVAIRAAA